jgi:photosystem II stability/assembly factor-like uncharacterized protein
MRGSRWIDALPERGLTGTPLGSLRSNDSGPAGVERWAPTAKHIAPDDGPILNSHSRILLISCLAIATAPVARAHFPHDVINDVAVSPDLANDGTVFAITRGNLVRSNDGGKRWGRLAQGLGNASPQRLAISPAFPRDRTVFLASKHGIFRTDDAGNRWQRCDRSLDDRGNVDLALSPKSAEQATLIHVGSDGSLSRSDDRCKSWRTVLPEGSDTTAVRWTREGLFSGSNSGALMRSTDAGVSWQETGRLPERRRVTAIAPLPLPNEEAPTLLIGTERGLYRLAPGAKAKAITNGFPEEPVMSIETLAGPNGTVVLATTRKQAVFRSDDRGISWRKFETGLTSDHQADWAHMPHFSHLAVAEDGTILLAAFTGLFRSDDHGTIWRELDTLTIQVIVGLAISPAGDDGYTVGVSTYGGGVYSQRTGESSWRVDNDGLPYPRMGTLAYSPNFASDQLAFTGTYHWILRSVDGGASWAKTPVEYQEEPTARSECDRTGGPDGLAQHYKFQMALWYAFSPAFAEDGIMFTGYRPEGIVRSMDGGASFKKVWHGCGEQVSAVVLSPDFPKDRTLFAATNQAVHVSRDAGESWARAGSFPGFSKANLAISPNFATDRTLYASGATGLWRSRDAGVNWTALELDGERPAIALGGLAVAPFPSPNVELLVQSAGGPLYHCRDDGKKFSAQPIIPPAEFSQMREFERDRTPLLAFSPHYPTDGTLYAASMDRIFRSTNRGADWTELDRGKPPTNVPRPIRPPGWRKAKGIGSSERSPRP